MTKVKTLAANGFWELALTDDGDKLHIGTRPTYTTNRESPLGLDIDDDQIDEIVYQLLKAKRTRGKS